MSLEQTVPTDDNDLTEDEMAFIADHMAACAVYLEHLDPALWTGTEGEMDEAALAALEFDIPDMPAGLDLKLQRRVNSRIQRGNLAAATLKLGTQGVMEVLLAMIRPILSSENQTKK